MMETYISQQLMQVCPLPPDKCGELRLQIRSEKGQTNWLTIDPVTFIKIEPILEQCYERKE